MAVCYYCSCKPAMKCRCGNTIASFPSVTLQCCTQVSNQLYDRVMDTSFMALFGSSGVLNSRLEKLSTGRHHIIEIHRRLHLVVDIHDDTFAGGVAIFPTLR